MLRFTIDGTKYEFDDQRLLNIEAIALQKTVGFKAPEWFEGIQAFDAEAVTGLVWLAKRRAGEDVRFTDIVFDLSEFVDTFESDKPADAGDQVDDAAGGEPDPTTPLDGATSSGERTN